MKVSRSKLFPYPVLWFLNDDYSNQNNKKDPDFSVNIYFKQEFKQLIISYDISLSDKEQLKLIEEGKASYCIHVENSLTSFRKIHLTKERKGSIILEDKDINHEIEVSTFVVVLEEINDYKNNNLNEDYDGIDLNVSKGSMLAVGDFAKFTIDKSQNDLGKKDSILSISKKYDIDKMGFEMESDRIIIFLNEEDFTQLQFLQASNRYKDVIYSILIVPALIYVFDAIERCEDQELDNYRQYRWFRSLERIFSSNNLDLNPQTIRVKTSYKLAQTIIGNPISKALAFLNERRE